MRYALLLINTCQNFGVKLVGFNRLQLVHVLYPFISFPRKRDKKGTIDKLSENLADAQSLDSGLIRKLLWAIPELVDMHY